ncbi:MAG: hypothetical protein AAF961_19720, partial [Planctomycetota bacterium]
GLHAGLLHGAVIHDETADGDLSGAFAAPAPLATSLGGNTIIGQIGANGNTGASDGSDADYFQVVVPAGQLIDAITIDNYESTGIFGTASFLGYSNEPITGQTGDDIQRFLLFNSDSDNIVPIVPPSPFGLSETGALGPGTHRFWLQETGGGTVDYQLTINVVPEPSALALAASFAVGMAMLTMSSRRRRE